MEEQQNPTNQNSTEQNIAQSPEAQNLPERQTDRVPTGIPGMDSIIEGGLARHSINLIAGSTGTGKRLLCHFLQAGG